MSLDLDLAVPAEVARVVGNPYLTEVHIGALLKRVSSALQRYAEEGYSWPGSGHGAVASLTVESCTALIAGLDKVANWTLPKASGSTAPEDIERRSRCAHLISQLYAYRRSQVAHELSLLAEGALHPEDFVLRVVSPLLCRAWQPNLLIGPPKRTLTDYKDVFVSPFFDVRFLASALDGRGTDLDGLLVTMETEMARQPEHALRWRETARYLRAAQSVHIAFPLSKLPLTVPVLLVEGNTGAGYVSDALILPEEALDSDARRDMAELVDKSLRPAWRAVERFLDMEVDIMRLESISLDEAWIAVGDYPGGGEIRGGVDGSSAGISLAVGLVSRLAALAPRPGYLATGAIELDGATRSVSGLRAKGQAIGLLSWVLGERHRVLVASEDDGQYLLSGAREYPGGLIEIEVVYDLGQAVRAWLRSIYGEALDRQIALGREASRLLGLD